MDLSVSIRLKKIFHMSRNYIQILKLINNFELNYINALSNINY